MVVITTDWIVCCYKCVQSYLVNSLLLCSAFVVDMLCKCCCYVVPVLLLHSVCAVVVLLLRSQCVVVTQCIILLLPSIYVDIPQLLCCSYIVLHVLLSRCRTVTQYMQPAGCCYLGVGVFLLRGLFVVTQGLVCCYLGVCLLLLRGWFVVTTWVLLLLLRGWFVVTTWVLLLLARVGITFPIQLKFC